MVRLFARYDLRHHMRGDGREKNPIAEVARGYEIARSLRGAKNGEIVRGSGAQARPGLMDFGVRQLGEEGFGGMVQALNRIGMSTLVKARFFDGGSDEQASIAARNEINLGRADDVLDQRT
jgi:hypothetical protein